MIENTKGDTAIVVTFGAAACMLSLLVMMGLKLKWFRARMTFDEKAPKSPEIAYVGVYRSTFSDEFEYRRPSTLPPLPPPTFTPGPSAAAAAVARKLAASRVPSASMPNLTTVSEVNERGDATRANNTQETKGKKVKEPKVKAVKEPKVKAVKEPKVKAVKESKVNEVKEPKVTEDKEPKVKAGKEPKVKEVKEPKVKEVKEPKVKEVKEPKVKAVKEPKVKEVKEPKVKEVKEPKVKVVKEPKVKEAKTKEPKVKEPKVPKEKGAKKKEAAEAEISQNNAFVNVQSSSSSPALGESSKTFSSMQSEGDLTPIPKRIIRNPVARGAQTYEPPPKGMKIDSTYDTVYADIDHEEREAKAWGASQQYLYDMDEESET